MGNKFNLVDDIILKTTELKNQLAGEHDIEIIIENITIIATDLGSLGKFYGKNNVFKKLSKNMFDWASDLKGSDYEPDLWSLQFYALQQQAEDVERNERGYSAEEQEIERENIEEALADNSEIRESIHNQWLTSKIINTCQEIKPPFKGQLSLELKITHGQKKSLDLFSEE